MPSLGIPEIALIMFVALVVVGPDRLPEVARTIGRLVHELRRASDDFKRSVATEWELDEPKVVKPIKKVAPTPESHAGMKKVLKKPLPEDEGIETLDPAAEVHDHPRPLPAPDEGSPTGPVADFELEGRLPHDDPEVLREQAAADPAEGASEAEPAPDPAADVPASDVPPQRAEQPDDEDTAEPGPAFDEEDTP